MCGLAGIIFGKKRRTKKEIQHLLDIFTRLLVLSEARGHHATGVAWVRKDGTYNLFKGPIPASQFVQTPRYAEVLAGIDNKTTILMGHTRWRTQGSESNNLNNHPILLAGSGGAQILTHNGHLTNADVLFRRFRFTRQAEVDSEILAHFAANACSSGTWDMSRFQRYLALCRGTMAAVVVATAIPEEIVLLRKDRPLFLFHSPRHRATLYASDRTFVLRALQEDSDWFERYLRRQTIIVSDHETNGIDRSLMLN